MEENVQDLKAFLKENVKPIQNIEMVVSDRITGPDGKPFKWILKKLTAKENNILRKKHTKKVKNKLGRIEEQFDNEKYQQEYMTSSILFPPLAEDILQKSYGALGEYDLLEKMLTADEMANLQIKLSGFAEEEVIENSINNLVEEAKN